MFRNREDAGSQLAAKLTGREFKNLLVLAVPRGGIVIGAALARATGAELDVVLSQRLLAQGNPDVSIGAVTDDGFMFLDPESLATHCTPEGHLVEERHRQLRVLAGREQQIRQVCPRATVEGRSVIVADDGVVTGSTMIAALQALQPLKPRELVVAVPVVPTNRVDQLRKHCDDVMALVYAVAPVILRQHFEEFPAITDSDVLQLLQEHSWTSDNERFHARTVAPAAPILK